MLKVIYLKTIHVFSFLKRWHDEFLYWNPESYANITEIRLPYDAIWIPDTTLYNS